MDRSAALMAASSERWEDRAAAAEALAAMDDADSDSALATLLKDEDLAVIEHASACLLALSTAKALRRFTAGISLSVTRAGTC